MGETTYQLVQDFFHEQYHALNKKEENTLFDAHFLQCPAGEGIIPCASPSSISKKG